MPYLKKKEGGRKISKGTRIQREFAFTPSEKHLLKRLGLKIYKKLADLDKPAEWLAFQSEIARSTVMEIIAGRSNPRFLTLNTISRNLGYKNIHDFLKDV